MLVEYVVGVLEHRQSRRQSEAVALFVGLLAGGGRAQGLAGCDCHVEN